MRIQAIRCLFACAMLFSCASHALDTREIFKVAEPSVVVVLASDAKSEKSKLGSGVVVGPMEIATSCQVLAGASDIVVTQGSALRNARLQFEDKERDLCRLHIDEPLPIAKPAMLAQSSGDVQSGQDLFVIGSPRGLERTISRTMASGLRDVPGSSARLIQTDAHFSGGIIGGALFDLNGFLVGIITPQFRHGDESSYALPAAWIAELAQRNPDRLLEPVAPPAAAVAPAAVQAAAAPAWMPRVGDRWKYKMTFGRQEVGNATIEVIEVSERSAKERVHYDRSAGFSHSRDVDLGFDPSHFQPVVALPGGYQLVELAPYASPETPFSPGRTWSDISGRFAPQGASAMRTANSHVKIVGQEKVRVPAGEFTAWKVETVSGRITEADPIFVAHCTFWYAPETKRTVKMVLFYKSATHALSNIQTYELVSFEPAK